MSAPVLRQAHAGRRSFLELTRRFGAMVRATGVLLFCFVFAPDLAAQLRPVARPVAAGTNGVARTLFATKPMEDFARFDRLWRQDLNAAQRSVQLAVARQHAQLLDSRGVAVAEGPPGVPSYSAFLASAEQSGVRTLYAFFGSLKAGEQAAIAAGAVTTAELGAINTTPRHPGRAANCVNGHCATFVSVVSELYDRNGIGWVAEISPLFGWNFDVVVQNTGNQTGTYYTVIGQEPAFPWQVWFGSLANNEGPHTTLNPGATLSTPWVFGVTNPTVDISGEATVLDLYREIPVLFDDYFESYQKNINADVTTPTSSISPLPAIASGTSFPVNWTSTDIGSGQSGVQGLYVQYNVNGGPWNTDGFYQGSGGFTWNGVPGEKYCFQTSAWDWVGHEELYPGGNGDACTTVPYTINVSANPSNGGTVSGGGTYAPNTVATVFASANPGFRFVNWTENGVQVSTAPTYGFGATRDRDLVANFQEQCTLSLVQTSGGSISQTAGGANGDCGRTVTVSASPNSGFTFQGWSNGSGSNPQTFLLNQNLSLSASFASIPSYPVTVIANPVGGGQVTGAGNYQQGSTATITATPNTGYYFVIWTDNGFQGSSSASYSFTVNAAHDFVGYFVLFVYSITTSASPAQGGTTTGDNGYQHGDPVTVTATPSPGYHFVDWTENGVEVSTTPTYTFTATANRALVAVFSQNDPVITVTASPPSGGSVSGGGTYPSGTNATVTATPALHYRFDNWTDGTGVVSTSASYSFTATVDRSLVANFSQIIRSVVVSPNPLAGGSVTGGGNYQDGSTVTVTAAAASGYQFTGWTESGNLVSSSGSYTFVVSSDRNLIAEFTQSPLPILTLTLTGNGDGRVTSAPAGIDCVLSGGIASGTCSAPFSQSETNIILTQTAGTGSLFGGWSGYCAGLGGCVVSMAGGSQPVGAVFTLTQSPPATPTGLTATAVSSSEIDLVWNDVAGETGYELQRTEVGVYVQLAQLGPDVTSYANNIFLQPATDYCYEIRSVNAAGASPWSGPACAQTLLPDWTLGVTISGTGTGTVVSSPPGIDCTGTAGTPSGTCSALFNQSETNIGLTPTPATGSTFAGWSGYCTGLGQCIVSMAGGNQNVGAVFTANPGTVTIQTSANPPTGGTTSGGGSYQSGSSVTVTATPSAGFQFTEWTEGGTQVSTNASYTFNATADRVLVASFGAIPRVVTATASPTGSGTVSGAGTYPDGSTVTLSATPAANFQFVNWTEGGNVASTTPTYTFVVHADRDLIANFTGQSCTPSVVVTPPGGGTVTGAGTYPAGTTVTLTATPNAGYAWGDWSVGGSVVSTSPSYTFACNGNPVVTARFIPLRTIAVSATPPAGGTVSGGGDYPDGASATVSATPSPGYSFVNWTEGANVAATSPSYTFVVQGSRNLVANFVTQPCTIAVIVTPPGGGTVTGGGTFQTGAQITLTAVPNAGYAWGDWSIGDSVVSTSPSYTLTCAGNIVLTARFVPVRTIVVNASPVAGGTVTGGGSYLDGTNVTVIATPSQGYTFANWTENGAIVSSGASYSFVARADRVLTANFSQTTVTISVTASPVGGGTMTGGGSYAVGTTATLTATPNTDYHFDGWTENGVVVSSAASYTFVVTNVRTLQANFSVLITFDPTLRDQIISYLTGSTGSLTGVRRQWCDQQGNKNGNCDLGDLLALLDKNPGVPISPETLAALMGLRQHDNDTRGRQ